MATASYSCQICKLECRLSTPKTVNEALTQRPPLTAPLLTPICLQPRKVTLQLHPRLKVGMWLKSKVHQHLGRPIFCTTSS